jgi:hypothetical protein
VWESEQFPLLTTVTRKRLVKTLQAGEDLVLAAVVCKIWRLPMEILLLVVPSGVCKWSINPFTNPNPVCSHTHTRDNILYSYFSLKFSNRHVTEL